jgi:thiosulfate/3-mercaptopyruvate sulfurtransferase
MSSYVHPEYLVSVDELAGLLASDSARVLDVTARLTGSLENAAEERCFNEGHIPGSVFFDVPSAKGSLSDQDANLPWMWPSPEFVSEQLRAAGVNDGDKVVIVASTPRPGIDSGTMWCTRAWWTLHHMGVDVAILHGGVEAWSASGRKLVTGSSTPERGDISVSVKGLEARATKEDVLAAINGGSACVIDALSADNFNGIDPGYGPRRGHITGATNVPYLSLVDGETAAFWPAEILEQRLSGIDCDRPIISYCGGAIAATVVAFALALTGQTGVRVYDGSLMEWSRDDSLPMTDPSSSD